LNINLISKIILRPHGKLSFILMLKNRNKRKIIDIGCGNNSYRDFYNYINNCDYLGVDIDLYNMDDYLNNKLLIVNKKIFNPYLKSLKNQYEVVFSSHNLEHCDNYKLTLEYMLEIIKKEGYLYLSFPTRESINFPKRKGALNYYADTTHKKNPPDFEFIIDYLKKNKFEIVFSSKSYKPFLLYTLGLAQEPFSYLLNQNLKFTWGYYGFESIIWAKKI
jgi:SAM-dependent methyltransferase